MAVEDEEDEEDESYCPALPNPFAKQFAFGAGVIYSKRLVLTDILP
jgi:hypothetical protein